MVWFCQLGLGSDCKDRPGGLGSPLQGWRLLIWKEGEVDMMWKQQKPGHSVLLSGNQIATMRSGIYTIQKLQGLYSLQVIPLLSMAKSSLGVAVSKENKLLVKFGIRVCNLHIKYPGKAATCTKIIFQCLYNCPDFKINSV